MSAKNKPVSKPMSKQLVRYSYFEDNYDRIFRKPEIPLGEDQRPKDRIKQGISSSTIIEDWDCTKKEGE